MFNYISHSPEQCEFIEIAGQTDLPSGNRLFLEIDGSNIVIFNIAGMFYAIGDVCTHDEGPLGDGDLDLFEVICPRHGARFDIRNGKVTALPAVVDIPAYPVRIVDGKIEIGFPRQTGNS